MKKIICTFMVCLSAVLLWGIQPNPAYGLSHYSKTLTTHSNADQGLIETADEDQEYPASSNPSSIIFEMRHYADNTYALPSSVKLTIALNENEQPRNNVEIFKFQKAK